MREGIYKVNFEGRGIKGFNIVALKDGDIVGCDQTHDTTGRYIENGNHFTADFVMTRHAKPEDFVEIANLDVITVRVAGLCANGVGCFKAKVAELPELAVTATFQWVCDT